MGKEKKKCVECEQFYKLRATDPYHRTVYCCIGEKSVNIISDKSVACSKFSEAKPINNFLSENDK